MVQHPSFLEHRHRTFEWVITVNRDGAFELYMSEDAGYLQLLAAIETSIQVEGYLIIYWRLAEEVY